MKDLIIITALFLTTMLMKAQEIYDFSNEHERLYWYVVNDGVMGGRSQGTIAMTSDGNGIFQGEISLENNGGFSSIRHRALEIELKERSMFKIYLKGDEKNYQFRVNSEQNE